MSLSMAAALMTYRAIATCQQGSISINRQSAIENRQCLESDYSLDVSRRVNIFGQSILHGLKGGIAVSDERGNIDPVFFNQIQRAQVRRRTAVRFESARGAHGRNQGWFAKHQIVQDAEIHAGMTMSIKQYGGLFAIQS